MYHCTTWLYKLQHGRLLLEERNVLDLSIADGTSRDTGS